MPRGLTPERKALLDKLVEEGWPMIEMLRTHGLDYRTVKRHHPEYRGICDKKEQGQLGSAARQLTLALRRNHPVTYSRA